MTHDEAVARAKVRVTEIGIDKIAVVKYVGEEHYIVITHSLAWAMINNGSELVVTDVFEWENFTG